MEFGLGVLRIPWADFQTWTLPMIAAALAGYEKDKDQQHRTSWEQTRWLATVLLQPHAKKGRKLKPSDLLQFPWEDRPEGASVETLVAMAANTGKRGQN